MSITEISVSHLCYSGISGASTVCMNLATNPDASLRQRVVFFGIEEPHEAHLAKMESGRVPWEFVQKKPGPDIQGYRAAARLLTEGLTDKGVIIFHGVQTLPVRLSMLIRKCNCHVVGYFHGPLSEFRGRNRLKTWMFLMLCPYRICVSSEIVDGLRSLPLLRTTDEDTRLVENAVDADFWCPPEEARAYPDARVRFCFSGTLTERKRCDQALAYIAWLEKRGIDVSFQVCGDGPLRQQLTRKAEQLGISDCVFFLGVMADTELRKIYQRCHFLLHPSHSEGLSMSVLEALACGCPVAVASGAKIPACLASGDVLFKTDFDNPQGSLPCEGEPWAAASVASRTLVEERFGLQRQRRDFLSALNGFQQTTA